MKILVDFKFKAATPLTQLGNKSFRISGSNEKKLGEHFATSWVNQQPIRKMTGYKGASQRD